MTHYFCLENYSNSTKMYLTRWTFDIWTVNYCKQIHYENIYKYLNLGADMLLTISMKAISQHISAVRVFSRDIL